MNENIRSLLKFLLFFIAAAWVLHTFSKNFVVDSQFVKFLAEKTAPVNGAAWFWMLRIHIVLALIALLTGPFGFVERLRKRNIRLHRYFGRIYVVSVLLNFVPSVYLAFFATGGAWSVVGFLFLNLIWAGTTFQAYRLIRRRQVQAHRRWMIRSYAVTLANLQLYVLKTVLAKVGGFDYESAYTIAVWSCWAFGLLVAELIIRKLSRRAAQNAFLQINKSNAEPELIANP